jgi:DNA-binding transcriptional LysR family regulator
MDWDHLRFFLATSRFETLTDAARQLGVNQTTVTRQLQAFQSSIGTQLFDRTVEGLVMTQAGEDVLAAAEQIEDVIAALDRRVHGRDARLSGRLSVTTVDMVGAYDAGLFKHFAERYPDIELELYVDDAQRSLTRREADVAIRWTDTPAEHLVGRRLVRAAYAPYGSVDLVGAKPKRPLASYPWLAWHPVKGARVSDAWMRKRVPDATIVCRFDSAIAMHAAVRAGMGVALMPCAYTAGDPGLRQLARIQPELGFDLWVLTHPDLRRSARVRAFLEHTADYFATHRARFEADEGASSK